MSWAWSRVSLLPPLVYVILSEMAFACGGRDEGSMEELCSLDRW